MSITVSKVIKSHKLFFGEYNISVMLLYILIIFLCALIHEIGHLIPLTFFGAKVSLSVTPAGFVIKRSHGIMSYLADTLISLSGPFANILTYLFLYRSENGILSLIGAVSLLLGIINLLPIKKLDGGEALLSFLSLAVKREYAEAISSFFSYVFMGASFVVGICLLLTKNPNPTFFVMYLWLFFNVYIKNEKNR